MQSKDKNDSVQLSTRYQQYDFAKRHLRGTSRPEVFPFTQTSRKNNDSSEREGDRFVLKEVRTEKGKATRKKIRQEEGRDSTARGKDDKKYVPNKNGLANCITTGQSDVEKYIVQLNKPKHSNDRVYGKEGLSPTLNTMQGGNRQPFVKIPEATKKGYAEAVEGDSINLSVPNSKTRRGRVGKGIANTLDTGMQQHTLQGSRIRRLTPKECERLQGFPENWTDVCDTSDSQRYKMCGNAVTVNVIRDIVKNLL